MSIELEMSEGGRTCILRGAGTVDDVDYSEAHRKLFETPERIRSLERILVDWTDVKQFRVSTQAIRYVAEVEARATRTSGRAGRIAIVAPQDLVFGLARMSEALSSESSWVTNVFRDRVAALAWIRDERAHSADL